MIKELKYEIKSEDISEEIKNSLIPTIMILVGISIAWNMLFSLSVMKISNINIIGNFIPFVIIFYFIFIGIPLCMNQNSKYHIVIDSKSSFFTVKNKGTYAEYNWASMKGVSSTENSIIININTFTNILIPKRIFETEMEMNETLEFIQRFCNKK